MNLNFQSFLKNLFNLCFPIYSFTIFNGDFFEIVNHLAINFTLYVFSLCSFIVNLFPVLCLYIFVSVKHFELAWCMKSTIQMRLPCLPYAVEPPAELLCKLCPVVVAAHQRSFQTNFPVRDNKDMLNFI